MKPVFNEGLPPGKALRLGNLVLMVGENQVLPPAVDVKRLAQVLQGHSTALNMPARSALTPRAFPRWLTRL